MKYLFYIPIIFTCFNCDAQEFDNPDFSLNYRHQIKANRVRTERYFGHFSKKDSSVYCVNRYDSNADLMYSERYDKDGIILFTDSILRNDRRLPIRKVFYNGQHKILQEIIFMYDTLGNYTGEKHFSADSLVYEKTVTLNRKGKPVYTKQLTRNFHFPMEEQFTYDTAGRIIKIVQLGFDGNKSIWLSIYRKNNLITTIGYLPDGMLIEKYKYSKGLLTTYFTKKTTATGTVKRRFKILYNEFSLCIERTVEESRSVSERTTAQYEYY